MLDPTICGLSEWSACCQDLCWVKDESKKKVLKWAVHACSEKRTSGCVLTTLHCPYTGTLAPWLILPPLLASSGMTTPL